MSDQRNQQKQQGGGRSRANNSNSSRNRNPVKLASNRKKWTKKTAKKRATIPAPPALAPKIHATWNSPFSAPATGLLFGQRPKADVSRRVDEYML
jgi:hypothetical protein